MKYHLTYKVEEHPEGIEHGEARRRASENQEGACTAVLLGSLLYPEDGTYSALFVSKDGRTGKPLDDAEVWKAWTMLTKQLSDSKTLSPNKRALCEQVWEVFVEAMAKHRETPPPPSAG